MISDDDLIAWRAMARAAEFTDDHDWAVIVSTLVKEVVRLRTERTDTEPAPPEPLIRSRGPVEVNAGGGNDG